MRLLKHEDPRAWSLTGLDNVGVICGHMHSVIVGLSKSFSKRHNAETRHKELKTCPLLSRHNTELEY